MEAKILAVDDDPATVQVLEAQLAGAGWRVATCTDSLHAVQAFREERPDLVLLDVVLRGLDGLSICRAIRAESATPVIFLSARNQTFDRVLGLRAGADDYLGKPYDPDELIERIKAVLRRGQLPMERPQGRVLEYGHFRFDTSRRSITYRDRSVNLSPLEASLLEKLARNPQQMLSRDELSRDVWHSNGSHASRTIDVHVQRLRKKLQEAGNLANWIITIKSGGYEFVPLEENRLRP